MKRVFKKFTLLLLSCLVAFGAFSLAACKPKSKGEKEDPTKTQIYVGMIDGGFGTSWFAPVKAAFEELYKDRSFESGKTGVQIMPNPSTTAYMTDHLIKNIANIKQELIFTESGFFFYYDFVGRGLILDITDAVRADLTPFGDTGTIEDKLPQGYKDYYLTDDDKYYALPNNEATVGIVYNIDLWESELLYLTKDYDDGTDNGNDGFITSMSDEFSMGPDGEYGTNDDGLPATYADFYKVCDKIKTLGIDPLIWYYPYVSTMMSCLQADYDPDAFMDGYDFSATQAELIKEGSIKGDYTNYTYETELVDISNSNGYDAFRSAGRFHALEFVENVIRRGYVSDRGFSESSTHLTTQDQYLYGGVSRNVKQAAMLVEGSWWENEATGTFEDMAKDYTNEYSKMNRRFGFLPFPKPDKTKVEAKEGYSMLQTNRTMVFINAKTPEWKVDLVKELLKFINTNEQIARYTTETNTTRPLDYTLTDAQLASMTNFGRELFKLHSDAKSVFPLDKNELFRRNAGAFATGSQAYYTKIGTMEYNMPGKDIYHENKTAKEWFEGLHAYRVEQWPTYIK